MPHCRRGRTCPLIPVCAWAAPANSPFLLLSLATSQVLHVASEKGLLAVMKKCLVWGTDPNIKNKKGLTATDLAVIRHQSVAAEYLLSKEIVSVNMDGKTLLHEAATAGMLRVAESLLALDISPNVVDPYVREKRARGNQALTLH